MHRQEVTSESFTRSGWRGHVQEQCQIERLSWIEKWGRWLIGDPKGSQLDLATGVGDVVCAVRERKNIDGTYYIEGSECTTCIDISEEEMEVAKRVLPSSTNFHISDVREYTKHYQECGGLWKLVTACEIIEHMNPFDAFQFIYNMIDISFYTVITTPNALGKRWDCSAGSGHTMLWTEDLLRMILNPSVHTYTFMSSIMSRKLPKVRFDIEKVGTGEEFLGVVISKENFA